MFWEYVVIFLFLAAPILAVIWLTRMQALRAFRRVLDNASRFPANHDGGEGQLDPMEKFQPKLKCRIECPGTGTLIEIDGSNLEVKHTCWGYGFGGQKTVVINCACGERHVIGTIS